MTRLIFFFIVMFPATLVAQNYPTLNQGDMQNMMQKMQAMQQCMESIDQTQLKELQNQSEQFKQQVDTLCDEGKRDQAQKLAMNFAKEIGKNPSMKKMQECSKLAQGAIPGMEQVFEEKDYSQHHVCDE
ncbi:MAG: hypothetical protein ACN4GW_04120 [Desulforhopalus sp.]